MDTRQNFADSVDLALGVMGTGVKESIYYYLKEHSISRDEIPEKLQEFREALRELLGYGVKVLEKLIIKDLARKSGISLSKVEGKDLVEVAELVSYRTRKPSSSRRKGELGMLET